MSENKIDTLTTLVEGLCAAMLDDEHGDGVDIAGGMYGEETSIWIKSISEKINKLTEHEKVLREALVLADSWLRTDSAYRGTPVYESINKVLEATK